MIKAVLFDFGGVLTESGKQGFVTQTVADLYHRDPKGVDIEDLHYKLRRGQFDNEETFFDELNARLGGPITVTREMLLEKMQAAFIPSPEVYALAQSLREHGIRTGILSNIFAMNARKLEEDGWYKDFDPLILSCDEGYAKPDKEIYDIALARLGLPGEQVVFIDDQSKCMPQAEVLGIHTIIAESPSQIVSATKELIRKLNKIEL